MRLFIIASIYFINLGHGIAADLYISMIDAETSKKITMTDDQGSRTVTEKKVSLPVDRSILLSRGYHTRCVGSQDNLKIEVVKDHRKILDTTVGLLKGKEFVLGKFPSAQGKFKLVFIVR